MQKSNGDKILSPKEKEDILSTLKGIPFENLAISDYLKPSKCPMRHGMTEEKLKEIYPQFQKVIMVTLRLSETGNKTTLIYRINKKLTYFLIFRFERKPKEIFNAYSYNRNIEKRISKKYFGL